MSRHDYDAAEAAEFPQDATLEDVKVWLRAHAEPRGTTCPACTRRVHIYHRPISAAMALVLIEMYKQEDPALDCWIFVPGLRDRGPASEPLSAAGGDFAKARWWGLLEKSPEVRADGSKRTGYWRLTDLGRQYVRGEVAPPRYAREFKSEFLGFVDFDDRANIHDALGEKFNFGELMDGGGRV